MINPSDIHAKQIRLNNQSKREFLGNQYHIVDIDNWSILHKANVTARLTLQCWYWTHKTSRMFYFLRRRWWQTKAMSRKSYVWFIIMISSRTNRQVESQPTSGNHVNSVKYRPLFFLSRNIAHSWVAVRSKIIFIKRLFILQPTST